MTTPTTQSTKTLFAIILLAVLAWACEFHPLGDNYQKRIIPGLDKIDLTNQKTGDTLFIGKVQEFTVNLINLESRKVYKASVTLGSKTIQSYLRSPNTVSFTTITSCGGSSFRCWPKSLLFSLNSTCFAH